MTAKIEPWTMEAAKQIDKIYIRANSIRLQEGIAPIIAAHAPKQEPSVPVSKLEWIRVFLEKLDDEFSLETVQEFDELIRQAEAAGV